MKYTSIDFWLSQNHAVNYSCKIQKELKHRSRSWLKKNAFITKSNAISLRR